MTRQTRELWNEWSEDYQDDAEIHVTLQWGIDGPKESELGLLGDLADQDVLVMGCGGGQGTIWVAERGANAIGVDLSKNQLEYARSLADQRDVDVEFLHGDVVELPEITSSSIDIVFSAYALQWVPDLQSAFEEAQRVLRDGGRFVFSIPHPMYEITDPEASTVENSYFDTGADERGSYEGIDVTTYRYRVSDIFTMLNEVGFDVDQLLEPGSDDPEYYETDVFGFDPELMSMVPPSLVVAANLP